MSCIIPKRYARLNGRVSRRDHPRFAWVCTAYSALPRNASYPPSRRQNCREEGPGQEGREEVSFPTDLLKRREATSPAPFLLSIIRGPRSHQRTGSRRSFRVRWSAASCRDDIVEPPVRREGPQQAVLSSRRRAHQPTTRAVVRGVLSRPIRPSAPATNHQPLTTHAAIRLGLPRPRI